MSKNMNDQKQESIETKCYFCKEEKEIGKEQFWCPRLRASHKNLYYYGAWVCLDCCRKSFYKNIFSMHLEGHCLGACSDCDFPIGSIIRVRKVYGSPNSNFKVIRGMTYDREKGLIETGDFIIHDDFGPSRYYGFEWDYHRKCLNLVSRHLFDGIAELVLRLEKLPTRKIIVLEDTLTYGCLSWGELRRYYWSSCDYSQHFKKEKWMDNSPVIIASGYLNKNGLNFDQRTIKKINFLAKQEEKQEQTVE